MMAQSFHGLALSLLLCCSLQAQRDRMPPVASPPSAEETSTLAEKIRRAEYRFSAVKGEDGVWSAPNRAHELRSRVSEHGLEVFPRTTSAGGAGAVWKLQLATTSFGRVDGAFELPRSTLSVTGERLELDHGYLVEWFVNEERGIEQGWTIPARPTGAEALSIGLSITGELALRIEEGGHSGVLVDAGGGAVLRYRDLIAFDATGRELEARLAPTPAGVAIEVDDRGATYPLVVDPLFTDPAWTAESNQAEAYFGSAVSMAGDVNDDGYSDVIVGAPGFDAGEIDEGRAFAFHGSLSGLASNPSWTAESNLAGALFGSVVATAGDVNGDGYSDVIVGAPFYYGSGDEGRAYVFHGSSSGLASSPAWTEVGEGEQFGYSVSTAGDVNGDNYSDVIVSGFDADGDSHNYVYHGSTGGLGSSPAWVAGGQILASTAGDVNGDAYSDVVVSTGPGVAAFYGSPSGLGGPDWFFTHPATEAEPSYQPLLTATTAGDVNRDGYGDLLIGVYEYYPNGEPLPQGEAFVCLGSASGLSSSPVWTVEPFQFDEPFRGSIAPAGDVNGDGYSDVVLGGYEFGASGPIWDGRAYVYLGNPGGLGAVPIQIVEPGLPSAFGISVSTAGDVNADGYADVIVGASGYTDGELYEGRALVYHGAAGGLAAAPAWTVEPNQGETYFGGSVSAGDVNGDGFSDVIVGAPVYGGEGIYRGAAFVFHGSASAPSASPAWVLESDQDNAQLGDSVSTAGDVNGDGYCDVIVGTPGYDGDLPNEGRVQVYHGSVSGLSSSPAWVVESQQADAWLGDSVATAGDVNGDGYSDVIVGAPGYDGGEANEGRAYVYLGSASGLATSPAWMAEADQAGALFGYAVATAGDVNADGYSDVVVGATAFDGGQVDEGRAFVFLGGAAGVAASPVWTAGSDQAAAHFGESVSTAGDVNGDGFSDVIVGAYADDDGETDEGRAFVFLGASSGLGASAAWTAESDQANAYFGHSVSTAGDVNGDGYSDVMVGAIWYDGGQVNEGRAYVYHGSATGLATSPAWTAQADQAVALLGAAVSAAGDVNGDGYADVIVGLPLYDDGQLNEGGAWIYFGNRPGGLTGPGLGVQSSLGFGNGLVRALQQRTRSDARPLSVAGITDESGLFRIRCEFPKDTAGWSWSAPLPTAHLEWEVKPLGVSFDGAGIQRGADQSLLPGGGTLTFDELTSSDDAAGHARTTRAQSYHWRARVATNSPLFPNTAWFSAPGSNVTEAKLRKPALQFP